LLGRFGWRAAGHLPHLSLGGAPLPLIGFLQSILLPSLPNYWTEKKDFAPVGSTLVLPSHKDVRVIVPPPLQRPECILSLLQTPQLPSLPYSRLGVSSEPCSLPGRRKSFPPNPHSCSALSVFLRKLWDRLFFLVCLRFPLLGILAKSVSVLSFPFPLSIPPFPDL